MSGNGNCYVIRFARNAPRPFCLVHCGVADAKASCGFARGGCLDLSRIYAALIAHLGCLAFESQGAFASQR